MQAVIFCGGLGTRLSPLTDFIPKSMVPVCGELYIDLQIELLKKNGVTNFIFLVGHKNSQIVQHLKKKIAHVKYRILIDKKKNQGTGNSLIDSIDYLDSCFFITYGDAYLECDLKKINKFFLKKKYSSMMIINKNSDKDNLNNININKSKKIITSYRNDKKSRFIDYGITFFKKNHLQDSFKNNKNISMSGIFNHLIQFEKLFYHIEKKKFKEIGSFKGLYNFKNYYEKKYI